MGKFCSIDCQITFGSPVSLGQLLEFVLLLELDQLLSLLLQLRPLRLKPRDLVVDAFQPNVDVAKLLVQTASLRVGHSPVAGASR